MRIRLFLIILLVLIFIALCADAKKNKKNSSKSKSSGGKSKSNSKSGKDKCKRRCHQLARCVRGRCICQGGSIGNGYRCTKPPPKCTRKCHRNARCINGKCVCQNGYTGNGFNCRKPPPKCTRKCHQKARCINGKCVCQNGYKGNGYNCQKPPPKCRRKCHKYAKCINGKCVCQNGYKGNGYNCKKPEIKCNPKCHRYANCIKGKCVCKKGYTGNGRNCKKPTPPPPPPSAGCKRKCHKRARCVSGKCVCQKGYTGNGITTCKKPPPQCKRKCHSKAKCVRGKCVCNKGYKGNGYSCTKPNPQCKRKCHSKAKCVRGKCVCNKGYKGNGYSCTKPPSQCKRKCHRKAKCVKGKCVCNKGYRGNGYSCKKPPSQCKRKCHRKAKCVRGKCVCNKGYKGNGYSCTKPPSQCKRKCHSKAKCVRGKCICNKGYRGNGYSCTNRKPPSQCKRKCHRKAKCVRGKCVCNKGYRGNGYSCTKPPSQCKRKCHRKAKCVRGKCVCNKGYRGNGYSCTKPPSQCKRKCHKKAKCVKGKCVCKKGYKGNGYTCKKPPSQCKRTCHKKAKCVKGKCVCNKGYKGNGYSCTKRPSQCKRKCHRKAKCVKGKCVCNKRYKGNGYSCTPSGPPPPPPPSGGCKRKCHKRARCVAGKCVCQKGYKGNGRTTCKKPTNTIKEEVVCEGKTATIKCPKGRVIKIKTAIYGRTSMNICKDPRIKTTSCKSKKPLPITRKACDGKASCVLQSNNGLYGDPCGGTYKYLTVRYMCKKTTTKCKLKCHKKAKCINGKCKCRKGYKGNGIKICKKTPNKCKPKCHKKAKCINGKCKCKKGYQGNGIKICKKTPTLCKPKCHKKAKCINGKCKCRKGYQGNGIKICKKVPTKCKRKCHKKAKCINGKCKCRKGYQGNGIKICKKVPTKCKRKCHKKAKCINGKCKCNKGYKGNGIRICKKTPSLCKPKCHKKARCINGKCKCKKGYKGNGIKICKKTPTLCKRKCHKKAKCINGKCKCNKGYKGNGIRICKKVPTPCKPKCHKKAKCVNGKCKCRKGFKGNGTSKCIRTNKCSKKCHKNASCIRGKCRCKKRFLGDGVNQCSKSCTCSASGDPHYRLFDGQMVHFMGACKYLLSKYTKGDCSYEVQVTNKRIANKRVSFTRAVRVIIKGVTVDLLLKRKVKVNGVNTFLPYKSANFNMFESGRNVHLKTSCNVLITWDGRTAVKVSVPKHFTNDLDGMCGNCNGKKDDYRTRDGKDVRNNADKYKLIGESYLIPEGNGGECGIESPPDPCTPALRQQASRLSACGRINIGNLASPFKECFALDKMMAEDLFEACVYDFCAYSNQPDKLDQVVCDAVEGLDERCQEMGLDVNWRTESFCPMKCDDNMEYSSAVSGCPATCIDADAPQLCTIPDSEGCQCKKGFVLSGDKCVPKSECGCRSPTGEYYPIGTEITSNDCSTISKCVVIASGVAQLQVVKRQQCHMNAECQLGDGEYRCVCPVGFNGDGIEKCEGPNDDTKEEVVCEGNKATIQCPKGRVIKILKANYGRTSIDVCKDPRIKTTSCKSEKPLPITRKDCDGKVSCVLQSNNGLYGDPCGGTYKYLTVTYMCEANTPKCGKAVCHENAECKRSRCVCKKGFTGDGVNRCIGTCTCSATGDPHYKTFDGQVIHFMGICTYTMVKSTSSNVCGGFNVEVKNENRGNKKVSFTKYVEVVLGGTLIRLDQKNIVTVDNTEVYTPYSSGNFKIISSGKYVRLQVKCGIVVTWDGRSAVTVSIPKTYGDKVTGLCGDCDGKKDDYKTAKGEDVSSKKNKYALIGQSYMVKAKSDVTKDNCEITPVDDEPCNKESLAEAAKDKNCGLLNPENVKSPFRPCALKDKETAQDIYNTCLYDFCSNFAKTKLLPDVTCESIEGYEEICEDMGLSITWRSKSFCPIKCPENMEYSSSVSGCPATCIDPNAPDTCTLPNSEGCQCKKGFVLSGNTCVPKAECGCQSPDGRYYPVGKKVVSSDCSLVSKCVLSASGQPKMEMVKQRCHTNARCILKGGRFRCACKKGLKGDGLKQCKPVCKPKCGKNAKCTLKGCKCANGFKKSPSTGKCIRSCKEKCGKNAFCDRKGNCKCKRGFLKSPTTGVCTDSCKVRCGNNASCTKKGKCKCKRGFKKSKATGLCIKKNKCDPKCGQNLVCVKGECKPQVQCKGKCGRNAECTKSGKCKCKRGFRMPVASRHCIKIQECLYNAQGRDYNGEISTTASGKTCQYWSKQYPQTHPFSNLGYEHNFCRNPDNEARPWCYTADKNTRWEFCDIPLCDTPETTCESSKVMACVAKKSFKKECEVPGASRIKYVTLIGKAASTCLFGETYGFYGNKIWSTKDCSNKMKVCLSPKTDGPLTPPPGECRTGDNGEDYKGQWSYTVSGKACQRWDSQYPHAHSFSLAGTDSENYCRNFDKSERPWCYTDDPFTEREYCPIPLCVTEDDTDNIEECKTSEKGQEYRGRTAVTESGRQCQHWEWQHPHKHVFSNLKDDVNFCRNPDNSARPWCYTMDPNKRWEYCTIPDCAACSIQEDIIKCNASIKITGKCYYKSRPRSQCNYSVQLTSTDKGSEAAIKTDGFESTLTNGGSYHGCAEFSFRDGTLHIEENVCECNKT